jgi:hypothetical protein
VAVKKVLGTENPADLFTKNLPEATLDVHIDRLGFEKLKDRPATAPALAVLSGVSTAPRPVHKKEVMSDQVADQRRGPRQEDWWRDEAENVTRHHSRPRKELFTPKYVENGPSLNELCPVRITEGYYIDNGEGFKRVDTWTSRRDAHLCLGRQWKGETRFLLRVEE